jgi:hypothetical protein
MLQKGTWGCGYITALVIGHTTPEAPAYRLREQSMELHLPCWFRGDTLPGGSVVLQNTVYVPNQWPFHIVSPTDKIVRLRLECFVCSYNHLWMCEFHRDHSDLCWLETQGTNLESHGTVSNSQSWEVQTSFPKERSPSTQDLTHNMAWLVMSHKSTWLPLWRGSYDSGVLPVTCTEEEIPWVRESWLWSPPGGARKEKVWHHYSHWYFLGLSLPVWTLGGRQVATVPNEHSTQRLRAQGEEPDTLADVSQEWGELRMDSRGS